MIDHMATPLDSIKAAQSAGMSDHLVRVNHLKAIQRANGWNDSELARNCGRSPQQVHSWFENKRNIGERLARDLEDRLGLVRFALDERVGPTGNGGNPDKTGWRGADTTGLTTSVHEVPVLAWKDLDALLDADNSTLRHKATHLETYAACSARSKFVQQRDDSMAPDIAAGDHLLFDPTQAPRAGDVVLIRLPSGEHFVRNFRPRTARVFEGAAANPAYLPLSSAEDEAAVVGVMVEHRRYRRS
jgi:SOS-response transcriptional repressor LexA